MFLLSECILTRNLSVVELLAGGDRVTCLKTGPADTELHCSRVNKAVFLAGVLCFRQGYQWLKDKILSEEGRRQQAKLKELQAIAERLGCTLPQLAIGTQILSAALSLSSVCPSLSVRSILRQQMLDYSVLSVCSSFKTSSRKHKRVACFSHYHKRNKPIEQNTKICIIMQSNM